MHTKNSNKIEIVHPSEVLSAGVSKSSGKPIKSLDGMHDDDIENKRRFEIFLNYIQVTPYEFEFQLSPKLFFLLNPDSWQLLWKKLKESKVTALSIYDYQYKKYCILQSNDFLDFICSSKISFLEFYNCDSLRESSAVIGALCNVINKAKIISLILRKYSLYDYTNSQWESFCNALKNANCSELDISTNGLASFDRKEIYYWRRLLDAINESKITKLNLSFNDIFQLRKRTWNIFCNFIEKSKLIELIINEDGSSYRNNEDYAKLFVAINKSPITTLEFPMRILGGEAWNLFCDFIRESKISKLTICDNDKFSNLAPAMCYNFFEAVSKSAVTTLTFPLERFSKCNKKFWDKICDYLAESSIAKFDYKSKELDPLKNISLDKICFINESKMTFFKNVQAMQKECKMVDCKIITSI